MRRAFWAFVALAAFAALLGCSKEEGGGGEEVEHDYFPLALGNSWTFSVYSVDTAGAETTYTQTQTIDHVTTYDSLDWFVMLTPTSDTTYDSAYYRKDDYFVYVTYFLEGIPLELMVSPVDPEVGATWSCSDTAAFFVVEASGEVECQEDVTVPAGTFSCFRELLVVESSVYGATIRTWLADGVGPVRIVSVSDEDSTDMQLVDYSTQ